jgi:hypothetical protein
MPALFAYIVAVGLLLGGGYGALNWLAAPEPTKLVAKAKPKPPPAYEASSEMASRAPDPAEASNTDNPAAASASDNAASTRNAQSTPVSAEPTAGLDAQAEASSSAADRHVRAGQSTSGISRPVTRSRKGCEAAASASSRPASRAGRRDAPARADGPAHDRISRWAPRQSAASLSRAARHSRFRTRRIMVRAVPRRSLALARRKIRSSKPAAVLCSNRNLLNGSFFVPAFDTMSSDTPKCG